jgi:FKBP-type peptidyl-prolyl cis-trans isomerase
MEPGDGENMPVLGDKVSIEYTASVAATGRAFDTTQGRGPMTFEVGQEPPKVLLGLDVGVRNMTLGETAEMKISSNFGALSPASPAYCIFTDGVVQPLGRARSARAKI